MKSLSDLYERTIEKIDGRQVLTPHLEKEIVSRGLPLDYDIQIRHKEYGDDGYFHPSGDTLAPDKLLYYKFHPDHKIKKEFTIDAKMAMTMGTAMHSIFDQMLINFGFVEPEDVEHQFVSEERWCSGTVDIRKCTLPNGSWYPVEMKTTDTLPKSPNIWHRAQLNIYMDLAYDPPVDQAVVLYWQKRYPHHFKDFVIERDQSLLDQIYARWRRVREAIEFDDPTMLRECCLHDDPKSGKMQTKECPARQAGYCV